MEELHRFNSNASKIGLTLTNKGDSGKEQKETRVQSLAGEKYPGKKMATHFSAFAQGAYDKLVRLETAHMTHTQI